MKKAGILNSDISRVLSYLGHSDKEQLDFADINIPQLINDIGLSFQPTCIFS